MGDSRPPRFDEPKGKIFVAGIRDGMTQQDLEEYCKQW